MSCCVQTEKYCQLIINITGLTWTTSKLAQPDDNSSGENLYRERITTATWHERYRDYIHENTAVAVRNIGKQWTDS